MSDHLDFNWVKVDEALSSTILGDSIPNRATLAETNIITNNKGDILLIDPHPANTWETWMFPYSSLILPSNEIEKEYPDALFLNLNEQSTLDDVANALIQLMKPFGTRYKQALHDGINQVIPELVGIQGSVVSVDFSLKFSKTSNSYTAYRFEGKKIKADESKLHINVPHAWLSIEQIRNISENSKIEGKIVAKNVIETLNAQEI